MARAYARSLLIWHGDVTSAVSARRVVHFDLHLVFDHLLSFVLWYPMKRPISSVGTSIIGSCFDHKAQ